MTNTKPINTVKHSETQEDLLVFETDNPEIGFLVCPVTSSHEEIDQALAEVSQQKPELPADIKKGKHRHFKGAEYEVLGMGVDIATHEYFVIYKAMYGDFSIWARPIMMFYEKIERDDDEFQRFSFQG